MSSDVTIDGVKMSLDAAGNVEETGVSPSDDVARIRAGQVTREAFLAECLDGAESDRMQGWHDYVSAVVVAAS